MNEFLTLFSILLVEPPPMVDAVEPSTMVLALPPPIVEYSKATISLGLGVFAKVVIGPVE